MSTAARTAIPSSLEGRSNLPRGKPTRNLTAVVCDLFLVVLAAPLIVHLRVPFENFMRATNVHAPFGRNLTFALLFAPILVLCCHWQHLYSPPQAGLAETALRLAKALAVAAAMWTSIIYTSGAKEMSRFVVFAMSAASWVLLISWRFAYKRLRANRVNAGFGINALIIGSGPAARSISDYLRSHPAFGYRVIGIVDPKSCIARLREIVLEKFVDEILVSAASDRELVRLAAAEVADLNVALSVIPEGYDGLAIGASFEFVGRVPKITLFHNGHSDFELAIKRAIDVFVAGTLLLLMLPMLTLIAAVVVIDSGFPIIYSSKRVGKKGRVFNCHKFRTMVKNADALKSSLAHLNEREGVLFKISNDPRLTRVGRFLRKYSFDELPQLWNVLVGEMSLVGPRPALPTEVGSYEPEHTRRITVTPGITGLWQIRARGSASFDEYVNLDVQYIERFSLWLDFQILFRTIFVVIHGTGT